MGALANEIIQRNAGDDQSVYLQVTRGVAKRDHAFPKGVKPTVFMMSTPLVTPRPGAGRIRRRLHHCAGLPLAQLRRQIGVAARQLPAAPVVRDVGAAETILFRDGQLTEASASNVFAVKDGVLLTPPKNNLVLPGITTTWCWRSRGRANSRWKCAPVTEAEVRSADEIWLTSSTKEVLAVTTLDGRPVGDGRPGPLSGACTRCISSSSRNT